MIFFRLIKLIYIEKTDNINNILITRTNLFCIYFLLMLPELCKSDNIKKQMITFTFITIIVIEFFDENEFIGAKSNRNFEESSVVLLDSVSD